MRSRLGKSNAFCYSASSSNQFGTRSLIEFISLVSLLESMVKQRQPTQWPWIVFYSFIKLPAAPNYENASEFIEAIHAYSGKGMPENAEHLLLLEAIKILHNLFPFYKRIFNFSTSTITSSFSSKHTLRLYWTPCLIDSVEQCSWTCSLNTENVSVWPKSSQCFCNLWAEITIRWWSA